jgi:phage/plasmid-like protein (TIGR03299 family)
MSHELDFTQGDAAIAYTGDTPWHGYGHRLKGDETLEDWIRLAGMNYSVLRRPVAFINNRIIDVEGNPISDTSPDMLDQLRIQGLHDLPKFTPVKDRVSLHRSDTNDQLAIVSGNYKIVQPKEIMEFFRELIADQGFKMHTAGVLADGKRVWALAETGKEFAVKGQDRVGGYLLLATSYDGKFSTTAQFTSIRVVCNNTLSWSLDQGDNQSSGIVRIPHMSDFNSQQVKNELGLLGEDGWQQFQNNVIKLADVTVTKRQAVEFFLELLGVNEEEAAAGKQLINAKKLIAFYESGPGSDFVGAKNTTWGLVNAVSFFTDHGKRAHNNGTRFNAASFGAGAKMKRDAMTKALDFANAA